MCFLYGFFTILNFYLIFLIFTTVFRKEITFKGVFMLNILSLFILTVYLIYIFNYIILSNMISEISILWSSNSWLSLETSINLRLDALSYLFVLLVTVIGLATNVYVLNYFKYEANEDLFLLLVNWFIFSMLLLVLANNLFTLFLGWESIGLSSFWLINFWNARRGTLKSSFKAFFFNKISDVFLLLFLVLINFLSQINDINVINLKLIISNCPLNTLYLIGTSYLVICTLFKSAQIIGHLWLPDSMEAPVPASALIHSATLVSAGVYLLLRFTPLISLNNFFDTILIIGAITAAYGGIVSASQTDMKKLLAYSTISHCGFLFVTISTELYSAVFIYLFLHGLFKALTFFCAGSFIRVGDSQDTRQMGNLSRLIPVDTIFLIICTFNLAGLPFSLGYLYKSVLIVSVLNTNSNFLSIGFIFIGLLTSVIYSYRLVYYSAFDISKEFFLPLIYDIQQHACNITKFWSLTTIVQIVSVCFLILFSLWIYIYFLTYFINSELTIDHTPVTFIPLHNFIEISSILHKNFYEIFYIVYILIIILITLITWRYEYSYQHKINFLLFLIVVTFTVILFISLKCGVMFWQKLQHNKILILGFPPINRKF